jgi:CBS domain-containing protein
MSAPLTTIPQDMSLRDAGHLLMKAHISGGPVVDAEGKCVGILTASDFVGWAETGGKMEEPRKAVSFIAPWGEVLDLDRCEGCVVRDYMTATPVAVAPTATIAEIAQRMVESHIHRVLVVLVRDHNRQPCGIISSTDIMAAVVKAAGVV